MTTPETPPSGLRRHRRRDPFVQIDSRTINDSRLSFKARGLLAYLLDKPDGWGVKSEAIARDSDKDGKTAIRTALHELAEFGYYRLERRTTRVGSAVKMGTAISELPVPEWAAEYAEFGDLAVPVMLQPDGSYQVVRADAEACDEDDAEPAPAEDEADSPAPGSGFLTPGESAAPESGFLAPENPASGKPGAGKPGSLIRQNTHTETQSGVRPAVGEAQVGRGTVASRSSPAGRKSRTPRRNSRVSAARAADIGAVIAHLPNQVTARFNRGVPDRLVQRVSGALDGLTLAELRDRIDRRWTHGGLMVVVDSGSFDAVAVATVLVMPWSCPDVRCEDGLVQVDDAQVKPCATCGGPAGRRAFGAAKGAAASAAAGSNESAICPGEEDAHGACTVCHLPMTNARHQRQAG